MPNSGSAAGGFLEGLVGGALLGHDVSRQRRTDAETAAERERKRRQEAEDRRIAAAQRTRANAVQDFTLHDQYGVSFDPTTTVPGMQSAEDFRSGTMSPMELGREELSPGLYKSGLSKEEREAQLQERARKARFEVGGRLMEDLGIPISGEQADFLAEHDLLDEIIERYSPASTRTGVVRSGDRNVLANLDTGEPIYEYDPLVNPNAADDRGSNLVTQRQLLGSALDEIDQLLARASQEANAIENRGRGHEILHEANKRAAGVARRRGFESLEELREAARRLNLSVGLTPEGGDAESLPPWKQRADELAARGLDEEEIVRMLRQEGLLGG